MRAYVNTPDGPVIEEVEEPVPAPDEALVAVQAFSINRGELALLTQRTNGWRPGQDVAGALARPAADGSGPAEGARVVGYVEGAGWAERVAVRTSQLAELPAAVTITDAAALPVAGTTGLRTGRYGGDLLGRRVLITGASGAVGRFQIQLTAARGATVVAVARHHADDLTGLGAAQVVPGVEDAEGEFPLILEQLGGHVLQAAIGKVARDGTIVFIGATLGDPTPISLYDFFGHENARLQSYFSYAYGPMGPDLRILVDLLADGRLRAPVAYVADWTDLKAALEALRERRVAGKIVLTVG
ncbi:zinc-binding dehydrogenase [Pseudonocardia acidicola]|uniref:Zinc-binding dehydrogenase n=1 Tax=Pseudonocardia acidicola TaxID=2724939 RepID=A0ABX1SB26_9PSEU|nr:zinc-binding dehydrogenase [Pseudonocardia acidicola]NMH98129.1 zinc-binding dehydrogenase [Pseudonocardia acidicola]